MVQCSWIHRFDSQAYFQSSGLKFSYAAFRHSSSLLVKQRDMTTARCKNEVRTASPTQAEEGHTLKEVRNLDTVSSAEKEKQRHQLKSERSDSTGSSKLYDRQLLKTTTQCPQKKNIPNTHWRWPFDQGQTIVILLCSRSCPNSSSMHGQLVEREQKWVSQPWSENPPSSWKEGNEWT